MVPLYNTIHTVHKLYLALCTNIQNFENLVKGNGFTSNYFIQFFFASSLKSKLPLVNKALPHVSGTYEKTDVYKFTRCYVMQNGK